ncbi:MAG: hypothetical protein LBT59_14335 [Clostridiales bacterium]|jgi:hypothetical protein|nr:hypothetical protein [Clostridiales bacterium]
MLYRKPSKVLGFPLFCKGKKLEKALFEGFSLCVRNMAAWRGVYCAGGLMIYFKKMIYALSAYPKIPKWRRKNPGECFNAGFFRRLG